MFAKTFSGAKKTLRFMDIDTAWAKRKVALLIRKLQALLANGVQL